MDLLSVEIGTPLLVNEHLPPHLKLKKYLDEKGIKYSFVADNLQFSRAWMTYVLKGQKVFTDENIAKVENLLNIKLR